MCSLNTRANTLYASKKKFIFVEILWNQVVRKKLKLKSQFVAVDYWSKTTKRKMMSRWHYFVRVRRNRQEVLVQL